MSKVFIEQSDLEDLVRDSLFLAELDAAGIDNWEGYGIAEHPSEEKVQAEIKLLLE